MIYRTQNTQNFVKRKATQNIAAGWFCDFSGFCVKKVSSHDLGSSHIVC